MEVLDHTKELAEPHQKKRWKTYFWEFFMIFLAVFCGFLAEYQLENTLDQQQESKYIKLLVEDLQTDTEELENYIVERKARRVMLDSLVILLSTGLHKQLGNETYFYARHVFNNPPFVSADGTIQQLKNAGGLRLITNEKVVNSILAYDAAVKNLKEWDEVDTRMRTTFRETGGAVFNAYSLYKALDANLKFVRPATNPQLLTDNPVAINNITFQIQYMSTSCLGNLLRAKTLQEKAKNLIDLVDQEYK